MLVVEGPRGRPFRKRATSDRIHTILGTLEIGGDGGEMDSLWPDRQSALESAKYNVPWAVQGREHSKMVRAHIFPTVHRHIHLTYARIGGFPFVAVLAVSEHEAQANSSLSIGQRYRDERVPHR